MTTTTSALTAIDLLLDGIAGGTVPAGLFTDGTVAHASRHVHVLHLASDGRIASDHFWCGGIWPAPLLARMEAARRARGL